MATGMVLVIVTRNIDLSVGSILGFVGMVMGVLAGRVPAELARLRATGCIWLVAWSSALASARDRRVPGLISPIWAIPAFIVTLGGLLVWRGAAWWVTAGRTVAPMDTSFRLLGGGVEGAIGATWTWVVGALCLRRHRRRAALRTPPPAQPLRLPAPPALGGG